MTLPLQWHIYSVNLEPRVGTKPGKQRPCLVIQPNAFVQGGLDSVVVLPITTKVVDDAFPLRVHIPKGACGLSKPCDVMIDQILAWDISLFRNELGPLPSEYITKIKKALLEFLDLNHL